LGLGYTSEPSAGLVVGDESLSIRQGALTPWFEAGGWKYYLGLLEQLATLVGFSLDEPYGKLKAKHKKLVLNGDTSIELDAVFSTKYSVREYQTDWEGLLPWLSRRHQSGEEEAYTSKLSKFFNNVPCVACNGARLKPQSLNVRVKDKNICELAGMSITDLLAWIVDLNANVNSKKVYNVILKEINSRLTFLNTVGLGYLSLDRYASTLSGGESQRIRLASQIGSGLTGVLYVLDEPSIGLHQKDNAALIDTLNTLKRLGNTVIVVEHDSETMQQADWLVEVGKYAGK
jgi:excinuclease ABC subunit A